MNSATALQYDPDRLATLAVAAREAKALQRDASDRAADLRERRVDVMRRAQNSRAHIDLYHGEARRDAETNAADLQTEVEALGARMAEAQDEARALGNAAAKAARLFDACLSYAVDHGLPVPPSLADEVRLLRHGAHPSAQLAGTKG